MAVDKKSQHIGNHGGRYTDNDGLSKQFTVIDHDKKPKISIRNDKPEENWEQKYRESLMQRILSISASFCPSLYYEATVRGEGKKVITWNEDVLNKMDINKLRTICVLTENKSK